MADRKSFWAWCLESEEPSDTDRAVLAAKLSARYGTAITARPVPSLDDAELRALPHPGSRLGGARGAQRLCTTGPATPTAPTSPNG